MPRKAPPSDIIVKIPDFPDDRERVATDLVALLHRSGVPAAVFLPGQGSDDNVRLFRQFMEQALEMARRCRHPDVRAELEEVVRAHLAELDAIDRGN